MTNHRPFTIVLCTITLLFASCDLLQTDTPGLLVPLTVDDDPALPAIDVNGTRLHAEAFGDPTSPMLVVLHGGPGTDYREVLNCARFADNGYFVVFYDQRGTGLSRRHPKETYTTIRIMIDDLDSVIARFRNSPSQRVVLLGQSWGAMLATAYVNEHPDRISGLILCEPGGFTWADAKAFITRTRQLKIFEESVNDILALDEIMTSREHAVLDYKTALRSAETSGPGNPLGLSAPAPFWRFGSVFAAACFTLAEKSSFDFTTNLSAFTPTVLFLYSERDAAYGRAYAEHVSSPFPAVQLAEITGTGHELSIDGWEHFAPIVRTYLHSIH